MKIKIQRAIAYLVIISMIITSMPAMAANVTTGSSGANWEWDESSKTLILKGGEVTDTFTLPADSTILVEGDTTLNFTTDTTVITTEGDVVIKGSGKLHTEAKSNVITLGGNLVLEGVTLEVKSTSTSSLTGANATIIANGYNIYITKEATLDLTSFGAGLYGYKYDSSDSIIYLRNGNLVLNQNESGTTFNLSNSLIQSCVFYIDKGNITGTTKAGANSTLWRPASPMSTLTGKLSGQAEITFESKAVAPTESELSNTNDVMTALFGKQGDSSYGNAYTSSESTWMPTSIKSVDVTFDPLVSLETLDLTGGVDKSGNDTNTCGQINKSPIGTYDWKASTKILTLDNFYFKCIADIGILVPDGTTIVYKGTNEVDANYGDNSLKVAASAIKVAGTVSEGIKSIQAADTSGNNKLTFTGWGGSTANDNFGINGKAVFTSGTLITSGKTAASSQIIDVNPATTDWWGKMGASSVSANINYSKTEYGAASEADKKYTKITSTESPNAFTGTLDFTIFANELSDIGDTYTGTDWVYGGGTPKGSFELKKTTNGYDLTLDGFNMETTARYAMILPANTTLILKGSNSVVTKYTNSSVVTSTFDSSKKFDTSAILAKGNLTIKQGKSGATLEAKQAGTLTTGTIAGSTNAWIISSGIYVQGTDLIVEGGTVNATGGSINATSISSNNNKGVTVGVIGGTLPVTSSAAMYLEVTDFAINAKGGVLNGTGGDNTCNSTNNPGSFFTVGIAADTIALNGGKITGTAGTQIKWFRYGVHARTSITLNKGELVGTATKAGFSGDIGFGVSIGGVASGSIITDVNSKGRLKAFSNVGNAVGLGGNISSSDIKGKAYIFATGSTAATYGAAITSSLSMWGSGAYNTTPTSTITTINSSMSSELTIQIGIEYIEVSALDLNARKGEVPNIGNEITGTDEDHGGTGSGSYEFSKVGTSTYKLVLNNMTIASTEAYGLIVPYGTEVIFEGNNDIQCLKGDTTFTNSAAAIKVEGTSVAGGYGIKFANTQTGKLTLKTGGESNSTDNYAIKGEDIKNFNTAGTIEATGKTAAFSSGMYMNLSSNKYAGIMGADSTATDEYTEAAYNVSNPKPKYVKINCDAPTQGSTTIDLVAASVGMNVNDQKTGNDWAFGGEGNGTYTFKKVSNTSPQFELTLSNFNMSTTAAYALKLPADTKIILNGTNTVTSTYSGSSSSIINTAGIYSEGNITFEKGTGAGKLTATGGSVTQNDSNSAVSYGIFVDNGSKLTVKNGADVIGTGGTVNSGSGTGGAASIGIGMYCTPQSSRQMIIAGKEINIVIEAGGKLTGNGGLASNSYSYSIGILSGNLSLENTGEIYGYGNAATSGSYGIWIDKKNPSADSDVAPTLTAGKIVATALGASEICVGLYCNDLLNLNGSVNVTASASGGTRYNYGVQLSYYTEIKENANITASSTGTGTSVNCGFGLFDYNYGVVIEGNARIRATATGGTISYGAYFNNALVMYGQPSLEAKGTSGAVALNGTFYTFDNDINREYVLLTGEDQPIMGIDGSDKFTIKGIFNVASPKLTVQSDNTSTVITHALVGASKTTAEISVNDFKIKVNGTPAISAEYSGSNSAITLTGTPIAKVDGATVDATLVKTWFVKVGNDWEKLGDGKTIPKEVGSYKLIISVSDEDENYKSVDNLAIDFTISPKKLTITGLVATPRDYNGTTTVTITGGTLSGKIGSENVTISAMPTTGTMSDKLAGTNKTVTVNMTSIVLQGTNSGNYVLDTPATLSVNIAKKSIAITGDGTLAVSKTYSGNTGVGTVSGSLDFTTPCTGDTLSVLATAGKYSSANVGSNMTVIMTLQLSGADKNNYQLASSTYNFTKAKITKATYTGAINKTMPFVIGNAHSGSLSVSDFGLPASFVDAQIVSATVVSDDNSIINSISNSSYSIKNIDTAGYLAEVEVVISSKNYDDVTVTLYFETSEINAVTSITLSTPGTVTAGKDITLQATANPNTATNKTIVWSIENAGDTGASVNGNILSTTAAGTVILRATIVNGSTHNTDYSELFTLQVTPASNDSDNGNIVKENHSEEGEVSVTISSEIARLKEIIFTPTELAQIQAGKNAIVYIVVEDIGESINKTEKEKVESVLGNRHVGAYLDLSLFKKVGDSESVKISNLGGMIEIAIEVPKELRAEGRIYSIVRVHDGETEIISGTYDSKTGTFTFETDLFSTYAIIYEDVEQPKTGDSTNDMLWLILMAGSVILVSFTAVRIKKPKKEV